jgi:hypothetical protein
MKARPILFSAPMIRALLEGRKTQTRRVIKPQPDAATNKYSSDAVNAAWQEGFIKVPCPYGQVGDFLYVRENICIDDAGNSGFTERPLAWHVIYKADGADDWCYSENNPLKSIGNKPSIHMPRWASRLTLEITNVRVERLQDIRDADAAAEGIFEFGGLGFFGYDKQGTPGLHCCDTARDTFECLWQSINGADSWDANPWVWVLEFKVHYCNVDELLKRGAV